MEQKLKIFVKYSEIEKLGKYIKLNFPNINVPNMDSNFFSKHKTKTIESRILLIENTI